MQKAGILESKEIIQIVASLTRDLEMEVDEQILISKFEQKSAEKDEIYFKKKLKLDDIAAEIKNHEA